LGSHIADANKHCSNQSISLSKAEDRLTAKDYITSVSVYLKNKNVFGKNRKARQMGVYLALRAKYTPIKLLFHSIYQRVKQEAVLLGCLLLGYSGRKLK
jgi:hypothetical protein